MPIQRLILILCIAIVAIQGSTKRAGMVAQARRCLALQAHYVGRYRAWLW